MLKDSHGRVGRAFPWSIKADSDSTAHRLMPAKAGMLKPVNEDMVDEKLAT